MTIREIKEYGRMKKTIYQLDTDIQNAEENKDFHLADNLKERREKYAAQTEKIEKWLAGIEDTFIYTIFELKLRYGMSDTVIGEALGYSRSSITKYKNDYLNGENRGQ